MIWQGFVRFLKEWGVIGLAIAVIIGGKLNAWVSALVDDILMPLIGLLLPGGSWRDWQIILGPAEDPAATLLIGHFLAATLDFLIVAFVVYITFAYLLKDVDLSEDLEKKLNRTAIPQPPLDKKS